MDALLSAELVVASEAVRDDAMCWCQTQALDCLTIFVTGGHAPSTRVAGATQIDTTSSCGQAPRIRTYVASRTSNRCKRSSTRGAYVLRVRSHLAEQPLTESDKGNATPWARLVRIVRARLTGNRALTYWANILTDGVRGSHAAAKGGN
jgi:hypothetical protein